MIDTYSKMGFAKRYTRKTPLTAADVLDDRVIPFFDEHEIRIGRVLTGRGTGIAMPTTGMSMSAMLPSKISTTPGPR